MKKVVLALASVLVTLVVVGSLVYGTNFFGSAAAETAPGPQSLAPVVLSQEDTIAEHAWLGILGVSNNEELAARLGAPTTQGVVVIQVIREPAEAAGLQPHDIITAVDGVTILDLGALRDLLGNKSPGDVVAIVYIRQGESQTAQATLGEVPLHLARRLHPSLHQPLPRLANLVMSILGGGPLERLITTTTVLEGENDSQITVSAFGGTVTAVQPATDTTPGSLTVQLKDGSAEETITLEDGVLLLKNLRPVELPQVQVGDAVIVGEVLVD